MADGKFHVIYYHKVLNALRLTSTQFLDFCILCGCDYNESIRLVGPATSYNYITKYGNIEGIKNIRKEDEINGLKHVECRTLFTDKTALDVPLPPLNIDKDSVSTYAESYLTPYRMEGLIPEVTTIYKHTSYEKVVLKINLSKLGL
jgi:5'-3' exonuclease